MTPGIVVAHDLVVAMDYGQLLLRGGAPDHYPDDTALLREAMDGDGVAADVTTVLVRSPHQNNFAMAVRVEVWDRAAADDVDDWDEAFEADLNVDANGTLRFESPTLPGTDCAVPPGHYRALITGRGIVTQGWPGSTTPGDSWRVRLWPTDVELGPRRLRSWNKTGSPPAAVPPTTVDSRDWTSLLRAELLARDAGDECCRSAEAATLLRLTNNTPTGDDVVRRLDTLLGDRARDPGVSAELGLVKPNGQPVIGLPPTIVLGKVCCIAAIWRGALLAGGRLTVKSGRLQAAVSCPNPETALSLVGSGHRIGTRDLRMNDATNRVLVKDAPALLEVIGATETAAAWRGR